MDTPINSRLTSILLGFVCIGFLLACEKSPPYDAIPAPVLEESGDTDLAELLNSIRLEERLPGLAAAIIVDGKLHSVAAVGVREAGTNNFLTVDDKFLIGSCAKAFTATTAAILVEEGRLSWQTTIRDAFPDLDMLPEYENITLEQLLSHRAGLPKNLKRLHTPPDAEESDNYALGWFTKKTNEGHNLIYHGGRGLSFNALVIADLKTKSALLLVTNAEVGHIHPQSQILKMHKKIKEYYMDQFELPFF
jgi:CubicO group peptidase (beta-lactamase class C family)